MADLRIKDLATETTTLSDGDFVMIDSPTNGTSKFDMSRLKEGMVNTAYDSTTNTLTITIGGA